MGPIIFQTERLRAREWTADDVEDMVLLASNPEVTRFLGTWGPSIRADVEDFVDRQMRMQAGWGWCRWAVELEDPTSGLAGVVGFSGPGCTFPPDIEVGWTFRQELWGMGLATEIGRAVVAYCFDVVGFNRLISCVDPRNTASLRVAQKVGFTVLDEIDHEGELLVRHELRNPNPDPPSDPRFRRTCEGAPMPRRAHPAAES